MEYTPYVRKPLQVNAVQFTEENMEELAPLVGSFRTKTNEDGSKTPFIVVDRRLVPNNVYKVWPGFWMTKVGDSVHVFTEPAFKSQFVEKTPDLDLWSFLKKDDIVPASADSTS